MPLMTTLSLDTPAAAAMASMMGQAFSEAH